MEMIADQMRAKIGTEKLHQLVGTLAGGMEPLRAEAQVQKLKELIDKARESKSKSLCCRSVVTVCRSAWHRGVSSRWQTDQNHSRRGLLSCS